MSDSTNKGLIGAIIFAAVVVSGSLVFFGMQFFGGSNLSDEEFQEKIDAGISKYIQDQQAQYDKQAAEKDKPKIVTGDFSDDDAFMGEKDAKLTIVEFSDYQCPYCKSFFDDTLPEIKKKYIDTGKVKLVYRDFPLDFHPNAQKAAEAAECAGEQNKYFQMHDKLFENQVALDTDDLKKYAKDIGLNTAQFNTCLDTGKMASEVESDYQEGVNYGVSGTPAFFINGKLIEGAQPFSVFKQAIDAELNK